METLFSIGLFALWALFVYFVFKKVTSIAKGNNLNTFIAGTISILAPIPAWIIYELYAKWLNRKLVK